jgi:hypothetical protein
MTVPIVLTSLADKRTRYLAEMEYHQKRIEKVADAIAKIGATMALWQGGQCLRRERGSHRENPGPFKWRELPQLVLTSYASPAAHSPRVTYRPS